MINRNIRIKYASVFAILLIIEVLIARFVNNTFIRYYVGDILVVIVMYCLIRIIIPNKCKILPIYLFVFATGVEVLQYFHFVQMLGIENNEFIRILLGAVFDGKDILCYGIGSLLLLIYEWQFRKSKN